MCLITVEHVPGGWLWAAPIEPTICYILLGELACLKMVLSRHID